jgi:hypothetical protein
MKTELINAMNYLESIGIELDSFYDITQDLSQTNFQGHYNSNTVKKLLNAEFESKIDSNGFSYLWKIVDSQKIIVVFA